MTTSAVAVGKPNRLTRTLPRSGPSDVDCSGQGALGTPPARAAATFRARTLAWPPHSGRCFETDSCSADGLAAGPAGDVDLLVGTNTEEGHLYLVPQGKPESATEADARAIAARSAVLGDALFGAGTARMAQAHARISGGRTHVYSFAYRSTALNGRLGAAHTVELPFVFDVADKPWLHGDSGLLGADPAPGDLAARVHAAWVAFAGTGDPGWAAYDPHRPVAETLEN